MPDANNNKQTALVLILSLCAFGGLLAAVVRPMNSQLEEQTARISELESKFEKQLDKAVVRSNERIQKLENWNIWWNQSIPRVNAEQSSRIATMENFVYGRAYKSGNVTSAEGK